MARDKGYPPLSRSVEVQIDVVDRANNPPVWDHVVYGPIEIKENTNVGAKVVSVKARLDKFRNLKEKTLIPSLFLFFTHGTSSVVILYCTIPYIKSMHARRINSFPYIVPFPRYIILSYKNY